ncbi:MAG: hypothetical protein P8R54_19335 [Myxococcota bacterium]|nr:hypothetical protein [Myxococcota bacterium]
MLILSLLIGCNKDREPEPIASAQDTAPETSLTLLVPEDVAWMPTGAAQVSGQARGMTTLTLNGASIPAETDTFSESVTLTRGLNHIVVSGVDVGGDTLTDKATVLAGEFASPGDTMTDALSTHIGLSGLDAIGALAAGALDPSLLLDKEGTINPIYAAEPLPGNTLYADLAGLTFSPADIAILPTTGALEVTVTLPDLLIDLDAYGEVVWLDYGLDLQMTAEAAIITAEVMITAENGELEVTMLDPAISLEGFAYDLSILPDFIEGYLFVETIQGTVEDMLVEQANTLVPAMIDETLTGLEFAYTVPILDSVLSLAAAFDGVDITADGVALDMGVDISVPGTGTVSYAGYLAAPLSSIPAHDVLDPLSLVLSDDLLNRALFELWRGGVMDLTLSTDDGSLDPVAMDGLPLDTATVHVSPQLPPVIVNGETGLLLQAGAVDVVAYTPGASFGEYISLRLTVSADASFSVIDGIVQPQLGALDLDIEIMESDWGIPNSSIPEMVDWMLPQEDLLAMVSDVGVALPSLGGITMSSAELQRSKESLYSVISIDLTVK